MLFLVPTLAFGLALVVTLIVIPFVRELALRAGWVDVPDSERKFHKASTPTIGGLAIAIGAFVGYIYLWWSSELIGLSGQMPHPLFWAGAFLMLSAGMYDDVHGLGFKRKFLVQAIAAYLLMFDGYRISIQDIPLSFFQNLDAYQVALISTPLTLLWIVGLINAVNLIDGLDGLAGGVVLIGFASLAVIFGIGGSGTLVLLALPMMGALIGFLRYNFNPASIFMGDSGSLFLGYMLAAYSMAGQTHSNPVLALIVPIVALSLPVGDAALAIVRRLSEGKAVCAPDHDHLHHRMSAQYPVRSAVIRLYTLSMTAGALAILMTLVPNWWGTLVAFATVAGAIVLLWKLGYVRLNLKPVRMPKVSRPAPPAAATTSVPREKKLATNPVSSRAVA